MKFLKTCYFLTAILVTSMMSRASDLPMQKKANRDNELSISGRFGNLPKPDSVCLYLWSDVSSRELRRQTPYRYMSFPVLPDGTFHFVVGGIKKGSYISMGRTGLAGDVSLEDIFSLYNAEPGDNIYIRVDSAYIKFSGYGATKYNCRYKMDSIYNKSLPKWDDDHQSEDKGPITPMISLAVMCSRFQYALNSSLMILSKYKSSLSYNCFQKLQAEAICKAYERIDLTPVLDLLHYRKVKAKLGTDSLVYLKYLLTSDAFIKKNVDQKIFVQAPSYSDFTIQRLLLKKYLFNKDGLIDKSIIKEFDGYTRQKLLLVFTLELGNRVNQSELTEFENETFSFLIDKNYRNILQKYIDNTGIGRPAYNFSLPDQKDRMVKLTDFEHKVVFVDFWFVGCGNCARYYQNIVSKVEEEFKNNPDVQFLTISIDPNKTIWRNGLQSGDYTSDKAINLIAPDGLRSAFAKQFNVESCPHPVLIDKQGMVFSNSEKELRGSVQNLTATINRALNKQ